MAKTGPHPQSERVIWIGFCTVFATMLICVSMLTPSEPEEGLFGALLIYGVGLAILVCSALLWPLTLLWCALFARFGQGRWTAVAVTAVVASVGVTLILALVFRFINVDGSAAWLLPWCAVPVVIATGLGCLVFSDEALA